MIMEVVAGIHVQVHSSIDAYMSEAHWSFFVLIVKDPYIHNQSTVMLQKNEFL